MAQDELRDLESALASDDENERYRAVATAASGELSIALSILERALGDTSWRVRKAAVASLAERASDDQAWRVARAGLADTEDAGRRTSAQELLERLRDRLLPRVLELAVAPEAALRKCAVDILALHPEPRAVDALLPRVEDEDPNVRAVAVEALGQLRDPRAVEALTRVLESHQRRDALEALAALRGLIELDAVVDRANVEPLLEDPLLRAQALRLIARCPGEEILPLLAAALDRSSLGAARAALMGLHECGKDDPLRRSAAVAQLSQKPKRVREALLAIYGTEERAAVDAVLAVASWISDPELCAGLYLHRRGRWLGPGLFDALSAGGAAAAREVSLHLDEMEPDDQLTAIEALTTLGDVEVAGRVAALLGRASGRVAAAAARCVGEVGAGSNVAALAAHLTDVEQTTADACAEALRTLAASFPAEVRAEILPRCVGEVGDSARARVAAVLVTVAQPEDAALLQEWRESSSAPLRALALRGLGRVDPGPQDRAALLREGLADPVAEVRLAALRSLARPPLPRLESLLEKPLEDGDVRIRTAALEALAEGQPEVAAPRLTAALGRGGEESRVAVRASRFLPQASRGELLREVFASGEVAVISEVARLLAEVEPDEALGLLAQLLSSADFEVRLAAVAGAHATAARWPERSAAFAEALRASATADPEALVREAAVALVEELGNSR